MVDAQEGGAGDDAFALGVDPLPRQPHQSLVRQSLVLPPIMGVEPQKSFRFWQEVADRDAGREGF